MKFKLEPLDIFKPILESMEKIIIEKLAKFYQTHIILIIIIFVNFVSNQYLIEYLENIEIEIIYDVKCLDLIIFYNNKLNTSKQIIKYSFLIIFVSFLLNYHIVKYFKLNLTPILLSGFVFSGFIFNQIEINFSNDNLNCEEILNIANFYKIFELILLIIGCCLICIVIVGFCYKLLKIIYNKQISIRQDQVKIIDLLFENLNDIEMNQMQKNE